MHKFLVHNAGDYVGVAVQEIKAGEQVEGVFMDTDERITVISRSDIPLGHKIALRGLEAEQPVIEYGVRVGLARQEIQVGELVHTHNIRTARW